MKKQKEKKNFKIHSATKVFQALRIFVNKEISELIFGLINAAKILKKDGILAVVTFHSLEDKIVKYFFKNLTQSKSFSRYEPKIEQKKFFFEMPKKKLIVPSEKELKDNPSSRSAKLRYLVKKENIYEIETDIMDEFYELLEIENLSLKLWKKFFVFILIFSLIVVTSLIKNSTKKIDDEIYSLNENIRFLENRLKDTKLEHDYLSSSEKLLEYQKLYFEDSLQKKTIDEINTIEILNNKFLLNKLKM